MLKRFVQTPWPSLFWTGLIFFLLTIHTGTMESAPLLGIPHADKLVHTILFGVLAWLIARYLGRNKGISNLALVVIILLTTIYGGAMEFYQDYFTTREFEIADIYSDGVGAILGAVYYRVKNKPL